MPALTREWKVSSYSAQGNCVQVRLGAAPGTVEVRNSNNPDSDILTLDFETWSGILDGVREGHFELPQESVAS